MDNGSGWLVSESGVWVPVAWDASVKVTSSRLLGEFVSVAGNRRTSTWGYAPRTWAVEERTFADWANAVVTLFDSGSSVGPLYWVPPLASMTNLLPRTTRFTSSSTLLPGSDLPSTLFSPPGDLAWQSDTSATPMGRICVVGGWVSEGQLRVYTSSSIDFTRGVRTVATTKDAPEGGGWVFTRFLLTDASTRFMQIRATVNGAQVADPFARIVSAEGMPSDPKADIPHPAGLAHGPGKGAWVTLDSVEVSHDSLGGWHPLADVSFRLTEVEPI